MPATPVQMYYLLRRQMMRPYRKPLIIFSPKSLLRHKESVSPLEEFANDKFRPVNEEWEASEIDPEKVEAGDVLQRQGVSTTCARDAASAASTTCRWCASRSSIRSRTTISRAQIERYKNATEIVWCQEEPRNQGAWRRIQHYLLRHLLPHQKLYLCGARFVGDAGGRLQVAARQAAEGTGQSGADAGRRQRAAQSELRPRPLSAGEEN